MASSLKISADTSEAKKSILELGKSVKDVQSSKVSIFTSDDKKFIRNELGKEIGLMKDKLKDNQGEIKKLVVESKNLKKGSDAELKNRHKINQAYKTQLKLAKEIKAAEKARGQVGLGGGLGKAGDMAQGLGKGGGIMGMLGKGAGILGAAGLAVGALGIPLAMGSTKQYMAGSPLRTRATGLGLNERTGLSPEQMAEAGLTEQQLLERRNQAAAIGGRKAGSERNVLQQARFERAYGLEQGQMTNVMGGLRASFGNQSNEAQAKLQASIMASGMEDAIGPYLDTMTSLLSNINENGLTNTDALINAVGELAAAGDRTPEQIARTFENVNRSVKGSSGEANAFLQSAFARGGIGGNTIGGTRFAMETGGIMGLDPEQFKKLGFGGNALNNKLGNMGAFGGLGERSAAIINQFKQSAGLKRGQSFKDISDPSQLFALQNLSNRVFGTEGTGGLEALSQLEKVQQGKMGREKFEEKLKDIREGKNPQVERLDKINSTLAGQTEVLTAIKENLMESIGQETTKTGVQLQRMDVSRVRAQGEMLKTGADAAGKGLSAAADGLDYISKGKLGEDLYDAWEYVSDGSLKKDFNEALKSGADYVKGGGLWEDIKSLATDSSSMGDVERGINPRTGMVMDHDKFQKSVEQGIKNGMAGRGARPKVVNKIQIRNTNGSVSDKTYENK